MKPFFVLAKKLGIPIVFKEAWAERNARNVEGDGVHYKALRLWKEGDKLKEMGNRGEADLLYAKGDALFNEGHTRRTAGDRFYRDKVEKEVGYDARIDWKNGEVRL